MQITLQSEWRRADSIDADSLSRAVSRDTAIDSNHRQVTLQWHHNELMTSLCYEKYLGNFLKLLAFIKSFGSITCMDETLICGIVTSSFATAAFESCVDVTVYLKSAYDKRLEHCISSPDIRCRYIVMAAFMLVLHLRLCWGRVYRNRLSVCVHPIA